MKNLSLIIVAFSLIFTTACTSKAEKEQAAALERQHIIDSMNMVMAKQKIIDSLNEVNRLQAEKLKAASAKTSKTRNRSVTTSGSGTYNQGTASGGAAPAQTKDGWSAKAKGAVIGGVAGAVGGAIINKRNPTAGAVIGGVGGAAVGTGVGAVIDKKKGR
jgi:hypothetical protein